jgi:chemotaxis protein CheC
MLNEMQIDLLGELVNMYISKAANMLSEMVGQRIILSVPSVEIISQSDGMDDIDLKIARVSSGHIVSSTVSFDGKFTGKAIVLFPVDDAKRMVNTIMGDENPVVQGTVGVSELHDTDFDVLKEIANIMINVVVGEFGNLLGIKLKYTVPSVELTNVSRNDKSYAVPEGSCMLILNTRFSLSETEVNGAMVIALSLSSLEALVEKLSEMLGEC